MGLLDGLPKLDTPEGQGLLAAAFQMMGSRGTLGESIGKAGMTYLGATQQAQESASNNEFRRLQMDGARRKADQDQMLRDAAKRATISPDMANAMSMGPTQDGGAMPQVQPGFNRQAFANAYESIDPIAGFNYAQSINKDESPLTVAPGASLIDRKTLKPLFTAPKEPSFPSAVQEYKFAAEQGYRGTFEQWVTAQKRAGASSVSVNMTDGQKGFDNEMKLGGAFKQEPIYKDHAAVQSAFSQINAALAQGTPISDTAAATKIMKILDPGSVVRESELGMAMAAGGRMDRLKDYVNQTLNGTKLTPQQRVDFGALASELTAASAQAYNGKRTEYLQQGKDYGLNSERALGKAVAVPSIMKTTTPTSGKLSVVAPNGKTYNFSNERELANWKMATGVK